MNNNKKNNSVGLSVPLCYRRKDPGRSAQSVGDRLQLNARASYVCGFVEIKWHCKLVHGCTVYLYSGVVPVWLFVVCLTPQWPSLTFHRPIFTHCIVPFSHIISSHFHTLYRPILTLHYSMLARYRPGLTDIESSQFYSRIFNHRSLIFHLLTFTLRRPTLTR